MNDHALFLLMQKRKNDPVIRDLLYIQIIRQYDDSSLDKLLLHSFFFDLDLHQDDPKFERARNFCLIFNGDIDNTSYLYREFLEEDQYEH